VLRRHSGAKREREKDWASAVSEGATLEQAWSASGRILAYALTALASAALAWCLLLGAHVSLAAAECANEELRSELHSGALPDCRAYERVTPAYTNSSILTGVFAASPEGSRVIGSALVGFAGTGDDTLGSRLPGSVYSFSRTVAQGWSAQALSPSAAEFGGSAYESGGAERVRFLDASTTLEATLWGLGRIKPTAFGSPPEEARCPGLGEIEEAQRSGVLDLFLEHPAGTFTRVGPLTPNLCAENVNSYEYRGASADLSHVVFSTEPGSHWPFDETVANGATLYEYSGVERPGELVVEASGEPRRKPALVGVKGGSGSTTLISRCGTRLGSQKPSSKGDLGSVRNAISASGRRIFFTAVGREEASEACQGPRWGELFAREEVPLVEGEVPAESIKTVPISMPSPEDCRACLASGEPVAAAIFQGASRDGSRVFFTTTEELLPGASGSNLYEFDFEAPVGERVRLLSSGIGEPAEVQGVARVSEDGTHVYFVARGRLSADTNGVGGTAQPGGENLYVYSGGHVAFVATLAEADSADWTLEGEHPVLSSENGELFSFTSGADVTDEGLNGRGQIFQYDAATGALVRASIGEDGYNDDDRAPEFGATLSSGFVSAYAYSNADSPTAVDSQAPSDGGVFFASPDALTPGALNDESVVVSNKSSEPPKEDPVPNIYEYRDGHVYLLSDGRDTSVVTGSPSVFLAGWDPSGQDVFFTTSDALIPSDGNTQEDLYDARVEGGIPSPRPPADCGEGCQGPLSEAPALPPAGGSATQSPESLVAPPAPAPKGTPAALPRAQKLAKALKACKRDRSKKARRACERNARRTYGRAKK
jgi:hypothetical protein